MVIRGGRFFLFLFIMYGTHLVNVGKNNNVLEKAEKNEIIKFVAEMCF